MKRFLIRMMFVVGVSVCALSCKSVIQPTHVVEIPIIEKAIGDSSSNFFIDFASYPSVRDSLPIGVFDSGTGGLTVLEVLLKADNINNVTGALGADGIPDFAGEDFEYLADQANMPYGNYSSEGKEDYLRELAVKDALFLLGDKYYTSNAESSPKGVKNPVKIIVIACNTATAYGLQDISNLLTLSGTGVKVIGVINAGVNAVFDDIKGSLYRDSLAVGVLATVGTITSNAYERVINDVRRSTGYKGFVGVVNQPCAGFAEAVDLEDDFVDRSLSTPRESYRGPVLGTAPDDIKEELLDVYNFDFEEGAILFEQDSDGEYTQFQLNSAANYARFYLVSLFEKAREAKERVPIKSVVLGCTHYPFLLDTLNRVIEELRNYQKNGRYIYAPLIAEDFTFIDPAVYTALECYRILRADDELQRVVKEGRVDAYISIPHYDVDDSDLDPDGGLTYDFKFGREPGTEEITTVQVPFSKNNINPDNLQRIKELVPYSYYKIANTLK